MNSKLFLLASFFTLAACDGPWNVSPADYTPPEPVLRLSLFAVGGKPFDTLWLERTQPIDLIYDSTRAFVQSATIQIVDPLDGSKVVDYAQVPGSAVAWTATSRVLPVAGKRYRLLAHVVWNADKNWPSSKTVITTDLVADAKVPQSWGVESAALVPVENLIPALSSGADVGDSATLLAPLEKDRPGTLARWLFTSAMLDSLRQGLPVFRTLHSGDSIWYISDDQHMVTNPDGKLVQRAYREILFNQHPGPDFGGVFAVERFDINRARILDPLSKEIFASSGKKGFKQADSAQFFQPGVTRYAFGPYPAFSPDLFGWPRIYPFSNLTLAYTGLNTIYFYSVEQAYVIYQSQLMKQASGSSSAIPYSNVQGGTGYFTMALVDSFQINLMATGVDTFSVQALHGAACRNEWKSSVTDHTPFDSLVACKGIDFRG